MSIITVLNTSTVVSNNPFSADDDRSKMVEVSHPKFGDRSSIPPTGTTDFFWLKHKKLTEEYLHFRTAFDVPNTNVELMFFSNKSTKLEGGFRIFKSSSGILNINVHAANMALITSVYSPAGDIFDIDVHLTQSNVIITVNGVETAVVSTNLIGNGTDSLRFTRNIDTHLGEIIIADEPTVGWRLGTASAMGDGAHNELNGLVSNINGTHVTNGAMVADAPGKQTFTYSDPAERVSGILTPKAVILSSVASSSDDSTAPMVEHLVGDGTTFTSLGIPHMPDYTGAQTLVDIHEVNPITSQAWTNTEVKSLQFGVEAKMPQTIFKFAEFTGTVGYSSTEAQTSILTGSTDFNASPWKTVAIDDSGNLVIENNDSTVISGVAQIKVFIAASNGRRIEAIADDNAGQRYQVTNNAELASLHAEVIERSELRVALWYEVM